MEQDVGNSFFLVDDHDMLRDGLRALLQAEGYHVVGEAGDGEAALQAIPAAAPDVAVIDVGLPGLNGIELTRELAQTAPEVRVIALSLHAERSIIIAMLRAGARAYLPKSAAFGELLTAVGEVLQGRLYLSPSVASGVLEGLLAGPVDTPHGAFASLTARERRIIQLIAEGHTSKEIAAREAISVRTLETHRSNIMARLRLTSVAALTKYAIREGLTTPDIAHTDATG
ncbi:MAG: response regulator transcription factor [Armatimonadetes bacterium]|nr:response regulator transcription factor [Armatimonadota bacterium]